MLFSSDTGKKQISREDLSDPETDLNLWLKRIYFALTLKSVLPVAESVRFAEARLFLPTELCIKAPETPTQFFLSGNVSDAATKK